MGVTKQTIVVEDRFREIFNYLPKMKSSTNVEFGIVFNGGDEKELNAFLSVNQNSDKPYPLIWLVYPFTEKHNRTGVKLEKVEFVLAVETNNQMLNRQRLEDVFKPYLLPLLFNMRIALSKACIINVSDEYEVVKYPNYSGDDNGDESATTTLWDAIKFSFDCSFNDVCLKPFKI